MENTPPLYVLLISPEGCRFASSSVRRTAADAAGVGSPVHARLRTPGRVVWKNGRRREEKTVRADQTALSLSLSLLLSDQIQPPNDKLLRALPVLIIQLLKCRPPPKK